ncbi:glycosyltransferase family 2 protein [Dysgonomonas sp. Marseille-P4677]|uniref:glycosyltransferase family 2 protein n=1 Tax=Dysgonomonas sp. Marseille-P4677 TaxID=2364790 RepID=UPI001911E1A8|nr:glycosyltransferase family 2 protein [Dysgonomonas sp. Marseille-P4677]MBK5721754.1 glycosyltransferase family 2 protein [Dysgonomonas sp. Marseille-P4677]
MKIIVIVVTYNGMKWYKKCFDSLIESTIPLETIIIDNNSSDGSTQFIKESYPEFKLIENDTNLGFGKANNIGLKYAVEQDADYVFLLNQDAWVKSDTIEKLMNMMEINPQYGILSPIHLNGSEDKLDHNFSINIEPNSCPLLYSDYVVKGASEDKIYPTSFVCAAIWMISKNCLLKVGAFDPIFPHYGEDNNYIERVKYHGLKIGIYPKVKAIHDRQHRENNIPNFNQQVNKSFIHYLVILTNIHYSLKNLWISSIYNIFCTLGSNLLHLSFKECFINIKVIFKICQSTPQLNRNRKKAKQRGISFL